VATDLILSVGVYVRKCCVTFLTSQGSPRTDLWNRCIRTTSERGTGEVSSPVLGDARVGVRSRGRIPSAVPEGTSREACELPSAHGSGVGRPAAGLSGAFRVLRSRPAGQLSAGRQLTYKISYFFKERNNAAVFNPQQRVHLNKQN